MRTLSLSLSVAICLAWVHTSFALDVRGPYLTKLCPHEATIVVHTDDEIESAIEYREHRDSRPGETIRTPSQKGTRHVFELAGLNPGSRYSYCVLNSPQAVKPALITGQVFFTTPPEAPSTFSFIAYGDSRDRRAPRRHKMLASNFLKHNPSFVMSTGDLLLGGPNASSTMFSDDWTLNFFLPMRGIIEKLPYLLTVGNHDQDSPAAVEGITKAFPNLEQSFHYAFRYANMHCIVLHIANQMQEFQAQKKWFVHELEKAQDADWRIVFLHVSPFTNGKYRNYQWTLEGREDFLKTCVNSRVNLVLSGHDHSYQRFHPLRVTDQDSHAVVFVVTALSGTNPYHAQADEYTVKVVNNTDHFCVVDIGTERLVITAYDNNNKPFDSVTLLKDSGELGRIWRRVPLKKHLSD